jgi:3-hydroxyisobutyrate dehydrogenase-like beta-hydroxyacid dehydrogenase
MPPSIASATAQPGASSLERDPREQQGPGPHKLRQVGVVGLGHMGQAFALNLLSDGYPVMAYDLSKERVQLLERDGVRGAARLAELAVCDVVLTSLPNDEALAAVALAPDGLAGILARDAIHISTSTVSPALSRHLAEVHASRGQGYVAAPVLGNPDLARSRDLFILAGGPAAVRDAVRPLLEQLGQRLFVIGEDPALASLVKLAGNVLTAATLESMGEVLALLRKAGVDPHRAFEVLTGSLFDGRVHKTYGVKIVEGRYSPAGMTVPLAVKDLRLALAEAERQAVPMPVASIVRDRLIAMIARGWADLDWSALGLLAARDAGLGDGVPANTAGEKH